jgi:hypothetical protein
VPASARLIVPLYDPTVLTGLSKEYWDMEVPFHLHSYNGSNIFYSAGKFYAVSENERQFSIDKFRKHEYRGSLEADSYDSLIAAIDALPARNGLELIEEGFHGFDIIFLNGRYYGVPDGDYKGFVVGKSIQEVKQAIKLCYSLKNEFCVVWSGNPIFSRNK